MTYKQACEEIEEKVNKWQYGMRTSSDAINDIWLVLDKLKKSKKGKEQSK